MNPTEHHGLVLRRRRGGGGAAKAKDAGCETPVTSPEAPVFFSFPSRRGNLATYEWSRRREIRICRPTPFVALVLHSRFHREAYRTRRSYGVIRGLNTEKVPYEQISLGVYG